MHSALTLNASWGQTTSPVCPIHTNLLQLTFWTLHSFALLKNMSLHEIPEPVVPPGQALDGVYLPQASRSPKRVRFSETNDHLQSDLCTRYRLHDMINRVSKRSYLCNSSFLKGMGITFSAGDNTAAARENTLKNKETRLPIWFWTPAWARLKTIKHLMTQLEWAHHP